MSYRRTTAQAIARGVYLGGLLGLAGAALMAIVVVTGAADRLGLPGWFVVAGPVVLLGLVGGLAGVAFGRTEGADIDERGIHRVTGVRDDFAPWRRIDDLQPERRGGRVRVAVHFDTGRVERLPAPYDGRWLAADPEFEQKLFMLRNLWENKRHGPADPS